MGGTAEMLGQDFILMVFNVLFCPAVSLVAVVTSRNINILIKASLLINRYC